MYGGDRSLEWELKLRGASYEEVAKAGGGIVNTVKFTRQHTGLNHVLFNAFSSSFPYFRVHGF